jgi:5'-nucleotidase
VSGDSTERTEGAEQVTPEEFSSRATPPAEDAADRRPEPGTGRLRCLVTNDDGIASEGLRALALVALEAGLEVVVAGPLQDVSGASASITAVEQDGRFVVERRKLPGLEACDVFGVGGLPAFIALTGARGAYGRPPDIVLSGINNGPNTGHAVLHSGTVGAALTGSTHGCRAMAVSIAPAPAPHWETAAEVARRVLPWLIDAPGGTVLNVNAPNVPLAELRGLRRAGLANFGAVQTNVAERGEGYVKISLSEIDADYQPGTDAALLMDGYATVTPLRAVCEAADVELPASFFEDLDKSQAMATGS